MSFIRFSMSEHLPYGCFSWRDDLDTFSADYIKEISATADIGYFLEVDLHYDESLHRHHNDYPLVPTKRNITSNDLSEYQINLANKLNIKIHEKGHNKLVQTLHHKNRVTLHYRSLQQYLSLGLRLTKVHRVLQFKQRAWLKPYIDLCTKVHT